MVMHTSRYPITIAAKRSLGQRMDRREGDRANMPTSIRRSYRVAAVLAALGVNFAAAAAEPVHPRIDFSNPPQWPLLLTQAPRHSTAGTDEADLPDGARIVLVNPNGATNAEILTLDFSAAAWPAVSFDASRYLFIARRSLSDQPAAWEFNLADGEARRITDTVLCRRAIYLSRLYALELDAPENRVALLGRPPGESPDSIFTCRPDGSDLRRITFSPNGIADLFQLTDGRLLFSMPLMNRQHLYTVHLDGTDLSPFAGIYDPPARRTMPCETADANVLFVESLVEEDLGNRTLPGGHFVVPAQQPTTLATVSRARSLRTRRPLTTLGPGGIRSMSPLPDGRILISYRPGDQATFGVYVLDPKDGGGLTRVLDDPDWDDLAAVAIAPRAEPAGRSSGIDRKSPTGQLYCLNSYLSDPADGPTVPLGTIDRVRIVRDQPDENPLPNTIQVLTEAKVEPDGSFFVEIPAETPIRVETLDETGRVLRAMRTAMWVMPGEERGCVGCHEDRELSPPNRHVMALRKPPQRTAAIPSPPRKPVLREKDAR